MVWIQSDIRQQRRAKKAVVTYQLPVNYEQLTRQQRAMVRKQYIEEQDGLCCFCQCSLDGDPKEELLQAPIDKRLFPIGFFKYPVHLHHDHGTGMTIGAVHNICNAILFQYFGQ
jgi:hypothetical protein